MILGVPKETFPGERRVALVPAVASQLKSAGFEIVVESGAGVSAGIPDADYEAVGARLVSNRGEVFASSEILLQVRGFGANLEAGRSDLKLLKTGQVVLGFFNPLGSPAAMEELARKGATCMALELLPRISRAQPMDALTSMATIAGYRAVLLAASALPKIFPMLITAAGTLTPARVLILGAGVAGLQAIATSRRLGAVVSGYDIRPAAKAEVESLGARFVEIPLETEEAEGAGGYARGMDESFYRRQQEMLLKTVAESDVVITTAAVPGRRAPVLITEEMVQAMRPGSVLVDMAAESGGNCALTKAGETVEIGGVAILGPTNLSSDIPFHASQMYARNLAAYLGLLVKDGQLNLDLEDPVLKETLVCHQGQVVHPQVLALLEEGTNTGESGGEG